MAEPFVRPRHAASFLPVDLIFLWPREPYLGDKPIVSAPVGVAPRIVGSLQSVPVRKRTLFKNPRTFMPRHESAKKRMRQNEKRRKQNQSRKSRTRTKIKTLKSTEDKEAARELLNEVKGDLDRLAAKGIIHKNRAANKKSKLEKYVDNLEE